MRTVASVSRVRFLLVLPLSVAVAVLGWILPMWLTLGVAMATVAVLLFSLRLRHAAGSQGAGVTYLCGCFLLMPATGVYVVSVLSVGQAAAFGTLLAFLMRPRAVRRPPNRRAFALPAGLLLLVGGGIAAYWNGTSDSVGFLQELTVVVLPVVLAMRRFGPTREEAMAFMKAWLVGVLLSVMAGLTFARFPSGRSAGFTSHPNQFGMQTAMAIPVVWGLYENGRLNRPQALLSMVVLWVAVLASGARSGLLAAGIGTLLVAYRAVGGVATVIASVLFGVLGAFLLTGSASGLASAGALGRLLGQSSTSASDAGRVDLMREGLARVSSWDTALLGAGWTADHQPHNLIILAWVSAGVMGILAVALLFGIPLVRTVNFRIESFEWSLAVAALTFLAAALLNNALTAPFAWAVFALMEFRWSDPAPRRADRPIASADSVLIRRG